ncbi:MAG: hypothetical protein IJW71_04720 [Clostridia bacterium]|nr:hypothetical protein [Clostridia bacterium]
MKTCVFFGHRKADFRIRPDVYAAIEDLIVKEDVFQFYVGHQGAFDAIVYVQASYGGAFKFAGLAKNRGKKVINLARNNLFST